MPVAGPLLANSTKNRPVARRRVPSLQSNRVSDKSSVKAPVSKQRVRLASKQPRLFPSFWRRSVADVRLFELFYLFFCSACLQRLTNEQHVRVQQPFHQAKAHLGTSLPGQAKLGRRHMCKAARVASTPPPANPCNSQGPYMWVSFQMSIIYGLKSASHSPVVTRSPANANMPHEIPRAQGQTKNGLKDDPRKGFLSKHLVFGLPGNS